mmetsp:Transcript_75684/g.133617  ORF Transcript_75684/g.133617 Transcript_75684/m.133617 type:complete len:325 (+) Transcript_75684:31-1005(+)|eukprot:CAMPEP_0197648892 /NCGR_PEP_ID=MMETSP1338-20131121/28019_1 /TAXON_ID=43686 ORGANISM="Pelagodinium beii, Strain RCC1491" /NCGR_SAMPLE_ID=MMETSP1338 /ASSEMBLY_ACC=CAM_ASM_000754 /LENGTH=324 /DNA_ID=CAMNT_0043222959 /DNA_START=31 /DNA_END=1005 /DNA_ORIENTATION=-
MALLGASSLVADNGRDIFAEIFARQSKSHHDHRHNLKVHEMVSQAARSEQVSPKLGGFTKLLKHWVATGRVIDQDVAAVISMLVSESTAPMCLHDREALFSILVELRQCNLVELSQLEEIVIAHLRGWAHAQSVVEDHYFSADECLEYPTQWHEYHQMIFATIASGMAKEEAWWHLRRCLDGDSAEIRQVAWHSVSMAAAQVLPFISLDGLRVLPDDSCLEEERATLQALDLLAGAGWQQAADGPLGSGSKFTEAFLRLPPEDWACDLCFELRRSDLQHHAILQRLRQELGSLHRALPMPVWLNVVGYVGFFDPKSIADLSLRF